MKRRLKFETGMDISVTIDVDLDVLKLDIATQMVEFWSGGDDVLEASDGDVYVAAARFAAANLMRFLIDGYNADGAIRELCKGEGWPEKDQLGMTIVDSDIPDFDPSYLEFEEMHP